MMDTFQLLENHGYLTVFVGLLLEHIGLPVPGELVLLFLGALVSEGKLGLAPVLATATVAVLLGNHFWYFLGRRGGRKWLRRLCRFTLGSAHCMTRTEQFFQRYGAASLLFSKFVPGLRGLAMPMAGMTGVGYRRFLFFDAAGSFLWLFVITMLGMLLADQLGVTVNVVEALARMLFLFLALFTVVILVLRVKKRLKYGPPMNESTPTAR